MPDITAAFGLAVVLVVVGDIYPSDDTLCCSNLIGTHNEERPFTRKYAILGEDIYQGMLGKECAGEADQVVDSLVVAVRPK